MIFPIINKGEYTVYKSDIYEKYTERKGIFEFSESKQWSENRNKKSHNQVQAALERLVMRRNCISEESNVYI